MKKILILLLLGLHGLLASAQHDTLRADKGAPQPPLSYYAWRYGWNGYGWGLHEGLNASLDLSTFATFGKHAPHKGGFGQRLSATWLSPLDKDRKLWLAVGGYVQHFNYGSDSYRDGALYAALGYRFNDHWEAWVYGKKNIADNHDSYAGRLGSPYYNIYPYYTAGMGMMTPGADVLGAAVKYSPTPAFSVQLSVEGAWYNGDRAAYSPRYRYSYPVPKE